MNISKLDGSIYGVVLFSQQSQAARLITRSQTACGRNGYPRALTNESHSITRYSRSIQSHWHRPRFYALSRTFQEAVTGGRQWNKSYFTSFGGVRSWNHTVLSNAELNADIREPDGLTSDRAAVKQSKQETLAIVDYYETDPVDEYLKFYRDPYLRKYAVADGPNLTVSDKIEDLEPQTLDGDQRIHEREDESVRHLRFALATRHRHPSRISLDTIWELYNEIPEPRMSYISSLTRHALMAALASEERKNQRSMLRYFAVVEDVKSAGFSLTSFQWNAAVYFATRYVATTTVIEIEAALKIWREMEIEAKVRGNEVTFNILFDAASKAGKFNLAEMIYNEMTNRGYAFNRYHFVSLVHFFGLKKDSGGVRAAYKEMVEAGEIVDTIVLNCLIASFIRCGEEASAEYVYEKMKTANKNLATFPHIDYTLARAITQVLKMFARVSKRHPSMHPSFQKSALLSPDLGTYRILINHYGLQLGDLSKVAQFLDEMKSFAVSLNGAIFLALFQSFAKYGCSGSDWSAQRLHSVWDAFLDALDAGVEGLYISTWMAMAVLEAHARYSTRSELLGVYECLSVRWQLDEVNSQFMLHFLEKLLETSGLTSHER